MMISASGRRGETEQALGFYEDMVAEGRCSKHNCIESQSESCGIHAHTNTHTHTHAGLHPTDKTFATLIVACSIRRDYADEALLLFERMKAAGHVPDELTYGVIYLFWLTFFWLDGIGWVGGVSERN